MNGAEPLLVAGAPRTGTTWIAEVLARAPGLTWINEPDNEWPNAFALRAKLPLGRYPALRPEDPGSRNYEELWRRALGGYRQGRYREALVWKLDRGERTMAELWRCLCEPTAPSMSPRLRAASLLGVAPPSHRDSGTGRVMVKSVHAPLALEWIHARLRPRMVVVLRHPLNTIAGWLDLGWGGCSLATNPLVRDRFAGRFGLPVLGAGTSRLQEATWEIGLFTTVLEDAVARHPDWVASSHDALCLDPAAGFRRLFADLGLTWTEGAEAFLRASDRPGSGFDTYRVAAEQPERWRTRLTSAQLDEIWAVLSPIQAPWVEQVARDIETGAARG